MEKVMLPLSLRELSGNLRNQLSGILGTAYLIKCTSLTHEQRKYIDDIEESGHQLETLADKLLEAHKV